MGWDLWARHASGVTLRLRVWLEKRLLTQKPAAPPLEAPQTIVIPSLAVSGRPAQKIAIKAKCVTLAQCIPESGSLSALGTLQPGGAAG